jgi:glycerol-3-phosphate acyltransferase PlsY
MLALCIAFSIIVPYLICSINPAIIAAKIKHGKDIRDMGSGSAGLTNALRTSGKRVAGVVLLFDLLKGAVSILLVLWLCSFMIESEVFLYLCMWIGSFSGVLGHCYPIYYRFKGGKAVLVTAATGLAINWLAALIAISLFIIIVLITRYVSIGSIIAGVSYAVCVWLVGHIGWGFDSVPIGVIFSSAIAFLLIFKHKDNIKRLIDGNENKLGRKKES